MRNVPPLNPDSSDAAFQGYVMQSLLSISQQNKNLQQIVDTMNGKVLKLQEDFSAIALAQASTATVTDTLADISRDVKILHRTENFTTPLKLPKINDEYVHTEENVDKVIQIQSVETTLHSQTTTPQSETVEKANIFLQPVKKVNINDCKMLISELIEGLLSTNLVYEINMGSSQRKTEAIHVVGYIIALCKEDAEIMAFSKIKPSPDSRQPAFRIEWMSDMERLKNKLMKTINEKLSVLRKISTGSVTIGSVYSTLFKKRRKDNKNNQQIKISSANIIIDAMESDSNENNTTMDSLLQKRPRL